ncbi:MAG: hypothetical protein EPO10_15585 [Reyranella sp.]|uniref:hypothetical protein n=1 Tax=Reyranella sp. TaxID=1929291 RepID=UPI00120F2BCE|nr:hypothetical protein [Reyranella sp.]TAJ88424.1 MAG: hypothetical protein EPO41_21250 [Reyranella sp.]TBR27937.1 MAG: hypothetical protein EPO10_15585 [Reyranella sp.]
MISRLAAFSLVLALAACASPQQSADDRTTPLAGRSYAVPNALLLYQYSGGTTRPIANSPLGVVDGCAAEGVASPRRTGFDCP